jgi:hypothetical protein
MRRLAASLLVALAGACGDIGAQKSPTAQGPASQVAALDSAIGVWDGELTLRGTQGKFGFVLQSGDLAFLTFGSTLSRAQWRRDGDAIRITLQGLRKASSPSRESSAGRA